MGCSWIASAVEPGVVDKLLTDTAKGNHRAPRLDVGWCGHLGSGRSWIVRRR
jgi:hypothetical protein